MTFDRYQWTVNGGTITAGGGSTDAATTFTTANGEGSVSCAVYGKSVESSCAPNTVSRTGSTNFTAIAVTIVGPSDLYVYCSQAAPSYEINAHVEPSISGATYSWIVSEGDGKVIFEDASAQFTYIASTGANNASSIANDIEVKVSVWTSSDYLCQATKTLTVRKPWVIVPGEKVIDDPPTPELMALSGEIPYSIKDQLCAPIGSHLSGCPVTEDVTANCWAPEHDAIVSSAGTFHDTVGVPSTCLTPTITQTISSDCATITQSVDPSVGDQTISLTQTGGNSCP